MKQIYIVIEGGCLRFVSTDDEHVINNVSVTVIDLDNDEDDTGSEQTSALATANAHTRIW